MRDRIVRSGAFWALLPLFAWAPLEAAAQSANSAPLPPDSPQLLRPGDMVRIQVWRQPELSGEFTVTDRGVIGHPLFRRLVAARRPVAEVEESVRLFLLDYETDPNFVVEAFFRVSVGGEVRQPNVHSLRPGTTVAEAVAMAGGATERGALDRVILRREAVEYRLDLTDPARPHRTLTVRSGDEIVVERRLQIFRNYVLPIISVAGSFASIYRVARR